MMAHRPHQHDEHSFALIVGAQRCGTTLLRRTLAHHPSVLMLEPERPEPRTFLADRPPRSAGDYAAMFGPTRATVLGEKSTSYLDVPASALRIRDALERVTVFAIIRDPIARAVSHYRFSVENGLERLPIHEALTEEAEHRSFDPELVSVSPYLYLSRGKYVDYLAPWIATFGDSMHVVVLERMVQHQDVRSDLFRAVGLDPVDAPTDRRINASTTTATAPPEVIERLRVYYKDASRRLETLLGQPLDVWRG